jgi:cyclophilin family peptidyl-prolyl cis-trans isomerase
MTKIIIPVIAISVFFNTSCKMKKSLMPSPRVAFILSGGSFEISFYKESYNSHVDRFIKFVSQERYNSTYFHKAGRNFYLQGGDPATLNTDPLDDGSGGESLAMKDKAGIKPEEGSVCFVSNGTGRFNSHQFIVFLRDLTSDEKNKYSSGLIVFGKVTKGLEVLKAMSSLSLNELRRLTINSSSVLR